jgi:hypothetical protein
MAEEKKKVPTAKVEEKMTNANNTGLKNMKDLPKGKGGRKKGGANAKPKDPKPNISQSGMIRALTNRGFEKKTEQLPYRMEHAESGLKVEVRESTAAVLDTNIEVPLGKLDGISGVDRLMRAITDAASKDEAA